MMSKFRFQKISNDPNIRRIQQEAEDNFAIQSDVETKMDKVTLFVTVEPKLISLSDGQKVYYNDGSDKWRYERIGGKLYKSQLTEVT